MIARHEGCHARAGEVSNTALALIRPFDLTAGKVCSLLTTHMTCDSVYRYDLSWSTTTHVTGNILEHSHMLYASVHSRLACLHSLQAWRTLLRV